MTTEIKCFDQTEDSNGQQLYKLAKLYSLPKFVKNASFQDIRGENLGNHQYADPIKKRYPCHTDAATYVSAMFFLEKMAEFDKKTANMISSRLNHFVNYYGISKSVKTLKEKFASLLPKDSATLSDEDYALVLSDKESPSGKPEKHYPLRNALEVRKAAEYLKIHTNTIPYTYRQKMASKLLEKANEYGASFGPLEDFVQKQAGDGTASAQDVASLLFDRARLLKRANKLDYAEQMGKLALTVIKDASTIQDNEQLIKLAELVDDVDRISGLNKEIDDLPRPEDTFFEITVKQASQLTKEHFATTSGNIYKRSDIDKLKLSKVKDYLGEDFANEVSTGGVMLSPEKFAEIAPTLPRGDAELLDQLMHSIGVSAIAKEAAYKSTKLEHEDLIDLAKLK